MEMLRYFYSIQEVSMGHHNVGFLIFSEKWNEGVFEYILRFDAFKQNKKFQVKGISFYALR